MIKCTFSEVVRAYFRATSNDKSGPELQDPMPEDGGDPRQDLVKLGEYKLQKMIIEKIDLESDMYPLLKILLAPNAASIVLTLPAEEVMQPFFSKIFELAEDHPLTHYYYGLWLLSYSEAEEQDKLAATHYEKGAILHNQMAITYLECAREVRARYINK